MLDEDITYKKKGRVVVSGTVNLILKDGCELDVSYNGYQQMGIYLANGATLNIYREKPTYDEKGNPNPEGKIFVYGGAGKAGIRVAKGSTLNVYGGEIVAEGTTGGAGIGGDENEHAGDVNIYGGKIKAEGGHKAAGIGGGDYRGDTIGRGVATVVFAIIIFAASCGISFAFSLSFVTNIFITIGMYAVSGLFYIASIAVNHIAVCAESADAAAAAVADAFSSISALLGITGVIYGSITAAEQNHGGDAGTTMVYGGTLEVTGDGAPSIGGGWGKEFDGLNGTLNVKGGTIKGEDVKGTDLPKRTITLDGVSEEVEVVGVNIDYGVNDVYTLDDGKLYFYMSDAEYEKLTEITVKDKDGKEETYYRTEDPSVFAKKQTVNITGVEAQDGTYNGLPQIGYIGTPTNEQWYNGEYEITYYVRENTIPTMATPSLPSGVWEKTTPENSGADGEGKAPVYVGDYIVRIAVPLEESVYFGYTELSFKIEKAVPEIVEQTILSGVYGTEVKDMKISGGVVKSENNTIIEGTWTVTDERRTDIPEVGTTENYEVTFTPETNNYATVTTMVVPLVYGVTPPPKDPTEITNNQKLIEKVKEKVSDPEVKAKLSDPEFRAYLKTRPCLKNRL